jgi:hypothetical protein
MDDATPRAARRDRTSRVVTAVGLALVAAVGVVACSGGGSDSSARTTTTISHATHVDIPLGDVSAASSGPPVTVSPEQSQQVLDLLTTYVKDAIVLPLRSGAPATADLAAVFDATTLTPATTTDRGVVLDEGLPKVTGDLDVLASPVAIVGLGDQGGRLALASAAMVVDVKGQTAVKGDPLHIVRRVDFVVAPDGFGGWKVTSYTVIVTRDGAGLSAPTTTTATTGAAQ